MRRAAILLVVLASTAAADKPAIDVSGYVTAGGGEIAGTVTDLEGKPLGGVKVHIAPSDAKERFVITDAKGNYKGKLPTEGPTYVYVEDTVKITGQLIHAVREGEFEAIAIRETLPPVVAPRAKIPLDTVPAYSETAQDKNRWTRAWLLLDVSETGTVRRVKLINKPGLDLDTIAVRDAFAIPFEPARDRAGKAVSALVVWTWEWPAFYWQVANRRYPNRVAPAVSRMGCVNSGPVKAVRDCTKPALAKAVTLPWIDKP
jgi:hypothetical protein